MTWTEPRVWAEVPMFPSPPADLDDHSPSLFAQNLAPGCRQLTLPTTPLTPSPRRSDTAARPSPQPTSQLQRQSRLPLQDEWVFGSTVDELNKIKPAPKSMVDIGAGPSRALEVFMTATGCSYTAVDAQRQAVATRIRAGSSPQRTGITPSWDLSMFFDNHFDLAFSRGGLGWITDTETRHQAVAEQIRVGWRSLFINFDWSMAAGGEAFSRLRSTIVSILEPLGFDPFYGAIQHAEVKSHAPSNSRVETRVIKNYSHQFRGMVLASALGILKSSANPTSSVDPETLIADVRAEMDEGAAIALPAVVATHCY